MAVGDSRGYYVTPHHIRQLTEDHTLAYSLQSESNFQHCSMGKALDNLFIYSPQVEEPYIGLRSLKLPGDDLLLLVSDGVTLHLNEGDILACCQIKGSLTLKVQAIFDAVMSAGGQDNLSAILIQTQLNRKPELCAIKIFP